MNKACSVECVFVLVPSSLWPLIGNKVFVLKAAAVLHTDRHMACCVFIVYYSVLNDELHLYGLICARACMCLCSEFPPQPLVVDCQLLESGPCRSLANSCPGKRLSWP